MIWLIYIIVGAVLGVAVGALMNIRAIFLVGSWIPTYAVLGALWGVYAASNYTSDKNRYKDKGVLLTETKEYQKRIGKKKDKTEKKDQQV